MAWMPLGALAAMLLMTTLGTSAQAQDRNGGLYIELNKAEDGGGTCLATFVVRNALGHTLDRFRIDFYVFDRDDVVSRQVMIDMAPLRGNKTTVSRYSLSEKPCSEIGRLLVNDLPLCRSETGESLDCLAELRVASKDRIELFK